MSSGCCSDRGLSPAASVHALFAPRSVVVIGASANPAKIGHQILENIVTGGYAGDIYAVNPKEGEICGVRTHSSVATIDEDLDVAVIAIPAPLVLSAVEQCGRRNVKHVVVVTSGFSEVGNIEGERQIVSVARAHGMRVLGPNVFGIYSAASSLNATFGPARILPGRVAIVTQSGALGIAMIGKTAVESLGLSALVSVGNKSDLDEADLLEYLVQDSVTRVILLYMEGVTSGDRLVSTLERVTREKPVVLIKSGRSKRGAMAAASHTGSLAGSDEVFDDIMRQCGVLRAESVSEAFRWVRFLSSAPSPAGRDAVIVTNGGGLGVLATDACETYGVALYDDQQALNEAFADSMPNFGSAKNPVDLTGQATVEDYARSLDVALEHPRMSAVIALYCETGLFDGDRFDALLRQVHEGYRGRKPVVFSLFGGEQIESTIYALRREGIPVFEDVYEAVSSLGALYRSCQRLNSTEETPGADDIDVASIREILEHVGSEGRGFLLAQEAARVAGCLGLQTPRSIVASDLAEAIRAAERIGYPVVLKIVSRDIVHKSDAGGVALDLQDENELIDAYQAILRSCQRYRPDAALAGVEVAEMVRPGVETIVGARQDPSFGPVVMFGLGGIYVEVMKDVAFRAAPIGFQTASELIADVRSYPLLLGVRGESRRDIDETARVLVRLSHLIAQCREITDIEINPLVVYDHGQGVTAADVRILFEAQGGERR
jgi:acetyl coenzyme A synthetase (ADP forming)-like protein